MNYTDIVKPCTTEQPIKHTISALLDCQFMHAHGDYLKMAKQDFEHMLQLRIIRPSSSSWASPLHMVPKKLEIGDHVGIIEHLIT